MDIAILILVTIALLASITSMTLNLMTHYRMNKALVFAQNRINGLEFAANLLGVALRQGRPGTTNISASMADKSTQLDTSLHKENGAWILNVEKKK